MPSRSPKIASPVAERLVLMGQQIRSQRKALRINATTAAEAAGMSRVSLYRIEKGYPSVTMGAYLNAIFALGLDLKIIGPSDGAADANADERREMIPARIRLADYPQLRKLAWQVQGAEELTPIEALGIYERNWRFIDVQEVGPREQHLIDELRAVFGAGENGV